MAVSMVRRHLGSARPAQDVFAVGIEAHIPQSDAVHQFLRVLQFPVASEDTVDELRASVLAHADTLAALPLRSLPHVALTFLEEQLELLPESRTGLDEVFDHLLTVDALDSANTLFRSLAFTSKLDQQQPEVASDIGHWCACAVMVNSPVVYPFAKRIGIEYRTEQDNRGLAWVPIFDAVPSRYTGSDGVVFRRFTGGISIRCRLRLRLAR